MKIHRKKKRHQSQAVYEEEVLFGLVGNGVLVGLFFGTWEFITQRTAGFDMLFCQKGGWRVVSTAFFL